MSGRAGRPTDAATPRSPRGGAAPLAAITLFLAAVLVAGFAFHAGEAAREAEVARAAGDLARRVEAEGIRAADLLRTAVEATRAGGDVRAIAFPAEVRDVPWRTQDDDVPDPDLLRAESLVARGDSAGAEAVWTAVADGAGPAPSRVAALRALARGRRAAGEACAARELLELARAAALPGSRAALLVGAEIGREDAAERERVLAGIEGEDYAASDPAERVQVFAELGGEPSRVAHLVAARALADRPDPSAVVSVPVGQLAWSRPAPSGIRRVAVASAADVLRAAMPSFADGSVGITDDGVALPAPFPGVRVAPGAPAFRRIEESGRRAAAPWRMAALAAGAALSLAAVLALRHERARRLLERRREDFVCAVTHELKTPVANVLLYAETLERHGASDPAQVPRFARVVASEALRLQARVQDLLDVASGRRVPGTSDGTFDIPKVVRRAARDLAERAQARGAVVEVRTPGPASARGSEGLAARALASVLTNAIEFGGAGRVTVSVEPLGREVRVVVDDEGPGIPDADRERVFEPFVRLGDEMTRSVPGSGLGLTLARRCAEDCGGTVRVEARPGCGARVVLVFAAAAASGEPAAGATRPPRR